MTIFHELLQGVIYKSDVSNCDSKLVFSYYHLITLSSIHNTGAMTTVKTTHKFIVCSMRPAKRKQTEQKKTYPIHGITVTVLLSFFITKVNQ